MIGLTLKNNVILFGINSWICSLFSAAHTFNEIMLKAAEDSDSDSKLYGITKLIHEYKFKVKKYL